MQLTGEQNLVRFAAFPALDYLGEFYGVTRLPARPAVTTLRLTSTAESEGIVVVPKGTRVRSKDGDVDFATDQDVMVGGGGGAAEMDATATQSGTAANGYRAGDVKTLVDPVEGIAAVENVAPTFGGAAAESDDRYRARLQQAPERLSVAGPFGAYSFHAQSVHQSITDAAVTNPEPGVVRISVLTKDGLPDSGLLDQVRARVTADDKRPLSDTVEVISPGRVAYTLNATLTLKRGADAEATLQAAQAAAKRYAADRRAGLGRDLVPSQIVAALSVSGVYDVQVASPAWRVLGAHEWADADTVTVSIGGVHDG
jgi:phage-related baseplate assembly protein